MRGRGHAEDGTVCQDRTQYVSRGGVQAICLSDGAGTAPRSEYGAQAITDAGTRFLVDNFEELLANDDGRAVKEAVCQHLLGVLARTADRLGCQVADLAATFLAVAVSGDRFIAVHTGDGVIGYVKDGALRLMSSPDNSEFANQTTFVTTRGAVTSTRLFRGETDGISGFIVMSDGTGASLYDSRSATLARACSTLISVVGRAPTAQVRNPTFKKQLRRVVDTTIRNRTKDDCSLAILARASNAGHLDTP
ncbi:PP2C family serine/threonine-protein phosphatase [Cellulosimicrobium sp. NPDC055967]|uniref:PP2C family serine/threonine-protein phosphatase n=1 Tax=Cellulosimicrobium sp. NPDC055967 TaxID=3345670 RepID=UPI0035D862BD